MMLRLLSLLIVTFFRTLRRRIAKGRARPTWTFSFEWIVRCLRADWEATASWPLARLRHDQNARPFPKDIVKQTKTRDGELGGIDARWFVPPHVTAEEDVPPLLFFHGGSFIYGSSRTTHGDLAARLALATQRIVIGIEYRLAPEHPYPAQIEDARRAFDALVASGVKPSSILLAGDSAGGNLAIELQIALRDDGQAQAGGAILISPWCDLAMPGASYVSNDPFDFGDRAVLLAHADAYRGEASTADPAISPTHAPLAHLSPTFICAGECEIPRDDILTFAKKLKDADVNVTLHVAKDMPHNAPMFAAYHPSGAQVIEEVAKWATSLVAG